MAFRLEDLLPPFNYRIDDGDLATFLNDVLQPAFDLACADALSWIDQQDVDLAGSNAINATLMDLGNPFSAAYGQSLNRRKLLVRTLVTAYKTKGTAPGLRDVIRALTGIEIVGIVSPATVDAWDLGVDVIGDTAADPPVSDEMLTDEAVLGPDPVFARYSFQIEVPRILTDDERDIISEIVDLVKPAHTHFLGFIEPTVGVTIDHWELDQSYLYETGAPVVGDEVDLHGP